MRRTKAFGTVMSIVGVVVGGVVAFSAIRLVSAKVVDRPQATLNTVTLEQGCEESATPPAGVADRGCKPCKDRPWCECTYNGAPRISCDPCCYDTQPYPTCLD